MVPKLRGAWPEPVPVIIDPNVSGLAWTLIFGLFATTLFTLFVIAVCGRALRGWRPSPRIPILSHALALAATACLARSGASLSMIPPRQNGAQIDRPIYPTPPAPTTRRMEGNLSWMNYQSRSVMSEACRIDAVNI